MAIYCSQGHPNPDGADFQRTCRTCGEDMFAADLLSTPAPVPTMQVPYQAAPRTFGGPMWADEVRRSRSAARWSLTLGILSLVLCGAFAGVPAIVMGNKAKRLAPPGAPTGVATAGLTLGWVSVGFLVLSLLVLALRA